LQTDLPRPTLDDLPQPHAVARGNAKQLRPARNEISFILMQDGWKAPGGPASPLTIPLKFSER